MAVEKDTRQLPDSSGGRVNVVSDFGTNWWYKLAQKFAFSPTRKQSDRLANEDAVGIGPRDAAPLQENDALNMVESGDVGLTAEGTYRELYHYKAVADCSQSIGPLDGEATCFEDLLKEREDDKKRLYGRETSKNAYNPLGLVYACNHLEGVPSSKHPAPLIRKCRSTSNSLPIFRYSTKN